MSDYTRISGLYSGLDTDNMIKEMMKAESVKVDRVKNQRIRLEWQQESYREVSSLLSGLQSEYFDYLKPSQNLRSTSSYNMFSASAVLSDGTSTTAINLKATSATSISSFRINSISQLATKDTWKSSDRIKQISGTVDFGMSTNMDDLKTTLDAGFNTFKLTVNGTEKEITLSSATLTDAASLQSHLETAINDVFGPGTVTVSDNGSGGLRINASGHEVTITMKHADVLSKLGFTSGDTNTVATSSKLSSVFTGITDADLDFSINGVSNFGIKADDTIAQMLTKINSSSAGVTLSFSAVTGKFEMTANNEGFVNNINLVDTDGFFANHLKIADGGSRTKAQDAILSIDGVTTTRATNKFEIAGVEVTLKSTHAAGNDIVSSVAKDATEVVKLVKGFIDKYNEVIGKINEKLSEKRYYDYDPLTAEQKESMTDDEIKLWEEKAKSGSLKGDLTLQTITSTMRVALYESVEGVGLSLADLGIKSTANYKDNGKLEVDEAVLKNTLETRSQEVIELFTRESTTKYSDTTNRSTRYKENGLITRINDILQDNIRLTRDSNGRKGYLIEKAGKKGDANDFTSEISKKLIDYDIRIAEMLETLNDKEDSYYAQFARLESAMSRYSSQADFIAAQFGG